MTERAYTLSEIDLVRATIADDYPYGIVYTQPERALDIERRLRQFMHEGKDPYEFQAEIEKKLHEAHRRYD